MQSNNEKAISDRVLMSDGSQKTLQSFWKDKPVVLVFLRHFG